MKSTVTYRPMLAWTMLFIYFLGSARMFQPFLDYNINYEYISTVLCENKEKPELKCNGKCYLNKELKKAAEEESNNKESNFKITEKECVIYGELNIVFNSPFASLSKKNYAPFSESVCSFMSDNTSPPPRV